MSWTDERVALLTKLWAEGLSASQIASRIGDVTRNAVIGKVHRLGLPGRATKQRSRTIRKASVPSGGGVYKKRIARPAAALRTTGDSSVRVSPNIPSLHSLFHLEDELQIPEEKRAHIDTLTDHTCRWPIGDPLEEGFHYCGCKTKTDSPYCEFHHGKAFNNPNSRRKARSVAPKLAAK